MRHVGIRMSVFPTFTFYFNRYPAIRAHVVFLFPSVVLVLTPPILEGYVWAKAIWSLCYLANFRFLKLLKYEMSRAILVFAEKILTIQNGKLNLVRYVLSLFAN